MGRIFAGGGSRPLGPVATQSAAPSLPAPTESTAETVRQRDPSQDLRSRREKGRRKRATRSAARTDELLSDSLLPSILGG